MYPVSALLALMLLTWGAAIWASFVEEKPPLGGRPYQAKP